MRCLPGFTSALAPLLSGCAAPSVLGEPVAVKVLAINDVHGNLVGANLLLSALFRDELTVESIGLMGLESSSVGNHEFDLGTAEGCKARRTFNGACFQHLAASTVAVRSWRTILPAYHVKRL